MHYERWKRHGDPLILERDPNKGCTIAGCEAKHYARGLCKRHYSQQPDRQQQQQRYEQRPEVIAAKRERDQKRSNDPVRGPHKRAQQREWWARRMATTWAVYWEDERRTEDLAELAERERKREQRIALATRPLPGPRHWMAGTCAGRGCNQPLVFIQKGRWKDADASYCRSCRKRRWGGSHRQRARYFGVAYEPINHFEVFAADGHRCQLCHRKTKGKYPHPRSPSLDHIIPLALGGPHLRHNVQTACLECNTNKGVSAANDQLRMDLIG